MQIMSQLPDPSYLQKFVCQGFGNANSFYVEQPQPVPRRISEYVVDARKWKGILPSDQRTVEGILSQRLQLYKCIFCHQRGRNCWGEPCLNWWQHKKRREAEARITLRDTGGPMGVGVFATRRIGPGTFLGDYIGELLPKDFWYPGDLYAFDVPGVGRCSSREYGNWTRFVNHRCEPNVRANEWMVGQRVVMMFRAIQAIQPGEQLFIEYGRGYFESANRFCKCDAYPGDHLPPPDDIPRRDDETRRDEMIPEQGRAIEVEKTAVKDDDSSLLWSTPLVKSTEHTKKPLRKRATTTSSAPKHKTESAAPKLPRTPCRQFTAGDTRRGWPRPEPDVGSAAFFLNVQRELQRSCHTPLRGGRMQTPKAPGRRRRVGPSGPVSALP